MVVHQAPLSMGFSRQEYWSGLPFSFSGYLPYPGIKPASPASPALAGRIFTTEPPGKPYTPITNKQKKHIKMEKGTEPIETTHFLSRTVLGQERWRDVSRAASKFNPGSAFPRYWVGQKINLGFWMENLNEPFGQPHSWPAKNAAYFLENNPFSTGILPPNHGPQEPWSPYNS